MPLLYTQVKMARGRSRIGHYVVDIPSFSELISFCTNTNKVSRLLATPVRTLMTYSPIYDDIVSEGHFCEDVEFLEEEVYHGYLTLGIARWLLQVSDHTPSLSPSAFGANVPKCDDDVRQREMSEIVSFIQNANIAFGSLIKQVEKVQGVGKICRNLQCGNSFLFRNIFLRAPKLLSGECDEILIYERLESHIGESPKKAKILAVKSGLDEAALDMNYYYRDYNVFYVGIESFTLLPVVSGFPVALASQSKSWPWKFNLASYKAELLAETVRVNRMRKRKNPSPFWT